MHTRSGPLFCIHRNAKVYFTLLPLHNTVLLVVCSCFILEIKYLALNENKVMFALHTGIYATQKSNPRTLAKRTSR